VKLTFRKPRKQQPPQPVSTGFTAKARLRNVGNGTIELVDNTIKFYVEQGRLKRQKQVAKEIPFADIETVERVENELNVTWKGVTDRFVIEQAELAETMCTKITEVLDAQRKALEAKEEAQKQKHNDLVQALSSALKITDSLFDTLRSLHGRVDWNRVESTFKCSKETFRRFSEQKGTVNLDYAKLSSAVTEHLTEDISKEAYSILKALFEYFDGLASQGEFPAQIHPNPADAKKVILAYYTLNDIILGMVVGDEEVGKESNELVAVLDDLAKSTGLTIDVTAVKDAVNKLGVEQEKESVIEESRTLLMQQLNALITA
jgi:uncharacterized protein (DUF2267 family)